MRTITELLQAQQQQYLEQEWWQGVQWDQGGVIEVGYVLDMGDFIMGVQDDGDFLLN